MFGNTTMVHSVRAHNEAAQLMGFPIMPESLKRRLGPRQICRARDRLAGSPGFPFLLFVGAWRHRHHFSAPLKPRLGFALTCAA
jgi:hypothetical protein